MKNFLIAYLLIAGVGCAQVGQSEHSSAAGTAKPEPQTSTVLLCELERVTWNPETDELSWVISKRPVNAGRDQPAEREEYTIHLDTATMSANGEGRRFSQQEAQQVGALMEMITAYTMESTVWWAKGLGEKTTDPNGEKTTEPNAAPESKEPGTHKGASPHPVRVLHPAVPMRVAPAVSPLPFFRNSFVLPVPAGLVAGLE